MIMLWLLARVSPIMFLKKFFPVMAFAFSTATSNATIPLNMETLERKMGVDRRISSFAPIPLWARPSVWGWHVYHAGRCRTAFTAQLFGVPLGPVEYATVIATATLASIGTAGVLFGLASSRFRWCSIRLVCRSRYRAHHGHRPYSPTLTRTAVNITGDAVLYLPLLPSKLVASIWMYIRHPTPAKYVDVPGDAA